MKPMQLFADLDVYSESTKGFELLSLMYHRSFWKDAIPGDNPVCLAGYSTGLMSLNPEDFSYLC